MKVRLYLMACSTFSRRIFISSRSGYVDENTFILELAVILVGAYEDVAPFTFKMAAELYLVCDDVGRLMTIFDGLSFSTNVTFAFNRDAVVIDGHFVVPAESLLFSYDVGPGEVIVRFGL